MAKPNQDHDIWLAGSDFQNSGAAQQFSFDAFHDIEPLDRKLGADPDQALSGRLKELLFAPLPGHDRPVGSYAILDAGKLTSLPEMLAASGLPHHCLFQGAALDDLGEAAPWVVELKEDNRFCRNLLTSSPALWHLWAINPGIYIRSDASLDALRRHFRKFTRVQDAAGNWFYLRFYDAAFLPSYLAAMAPAKLDQFLGPSDAVIAFRPSAEGAGQKTGRASRISRKVTDRHHPV